MPVPGFAIGFWASGRGAVRGVAWVRLGVRARVGAGEGDDRHRDASFGTLGARHWWRVFGILLLTQLITQMLTGILCCRSSARLGGVRHRRTSGCAFYLFTMLGSRSPGWSPTRSVPG